MTVADIYDYIASVAQATISKEVVIALVAAYMGARATSRATTKAHEYATKKSEEDEEKLTKNTLLLIGVEITTAWDIYSEEYGRELFELETSEPYLCTFPIGKNPFPIFDSVPPCLTNINPEISARLVRLYMRMKGLVRMIELNNKDFDTICIAGRDAVQKLVNKAVDDKVEINDEMSKKLHDYYQHYIREESKVLDMGGTADAMKSITKELDNLMRTIKLDIDRIAKQDT